MTERFVAFDGVTKTFAGGVHAVRDLNLDIARGEFVTFLGPSGSGKTTSLMMLAGFETPTAGSILLDGRSLDRLPPYHRGIGMVFQSYALFPHMTVAENIAFPLTVRRRPRAEIEDAVRQALDLVQLTAMGGRRPAQLSGGQQQRVALARALVFKPPLVLMDEPLGALDRQLREHMQIEIKHIHARLGVTLVYVTHDQGEALTMSDRIAIFRDGSLQQVGLPGEVYERPLTSFVAQFVGESNQFAGTLRDVTGLVELDGGWRMPATIVHPLAIGARTTVSVRPERIRLSRDDGAAGAVQELIYHGDHLRVVVRTDHGHAVFAKLLAGAVPAWVRDGAAIRVSWDAADARALDALPNHTTEEKLQ
ncbi:ABC transporter ATP-binding protein [Roseomonas terrae]|uniref:Spermidine/putrescine import ATP-binding protein PotA n=1 Tax=Neoroseomonas terrae TaxID=424799 RepID=A0ABS5EGC2_9PROT|nr:ABC transporter ATP-binding protein [Neoroseomonas terrae]MBR0650071.1 ABC transporter ATP-binding protein [Neoroseomonas terrae]